MTDFREPLLDAQDIQGNIIPGFNRQQQYFAAFEVSDGVALRHALTSLPPLTTLATVLPNRDERKLAIVRGAGRPVRDDLWLNLALGPRATDLLGAQQVRRLDSSFDRGMRASMTGDPTSRTLAAGEPNPSHRDYWLVGSPGAPCDVLLIFAHDSDVKGMALPVIDEFSSLLGTRPTYEELGQLLPGEIEHFGFRDGISQPGVLGRVVVNGEERFITTRYGVPSQGETRFGKPGQPLVWPGQFLTGQPTFSGDEEPLEAEFTNGSFLVFRRLQQDVRAFVSDTAAIAHSIGEATGTQLSAEDLRARIVGRFRSGASLMRHPTEPAGAEGPLEINYFSFGAELPTIQLSDGTQVRGSHADPDVLRGRRCPVWAHTRKVNPRDLGTDRGGMEETLGFQMLRRGIPFGPPYNYVDESASGNAESRGLLFVAYQRKIDDQFGTLNRGWMNNRNAPSAGGFDLLVGQNVDEETGLHGAKSATYFPGGGAEGVAFEAERQWVIPTGGAFLFAPSLGFMEKFVFSGGSVG